MIYVHSLGRAARYFPEKIALSSGTKRLSFRELHEEVANLVSILVDQGFQSGDRLALLLPNEPEYIELIYACSWLGVIAVPLNTRLSQVEIDRILVDAQPRGLFRHSSFSAPTVLPPLVRILDKEPLTPSVKAPPKPIYDPDAVLAIVYTSGTTGRPKGAVLTHANVIENVHALNLWMPSRDAEVFLHAAPLFHIVDLPFLFAAPVFGTCQVTIPKFDPHSFCETVQRERVTHTVLVPTMINLITQFPEFGTYDLTSLKQIAYGGSPMASELIRRIRELLPNIRLVQGYGLSETGFLTALLDHEHVPERLTSCGRPCAGIELRVVDESGEEVETGKHGELVARGGNVMRGYWNNPEETASAFRGGMFRTGDIGYQDQAGYFYILDRLKDMIVTGGENVYSGEVEAVIYGHPAVREAAVFGIPDEKWGEIVMACVGLRPGASLSTEELIAYCRQSLANYKIPRRIEFSATELPKGGSGKILKRVLRDRFWTHQARAVS
jgi:acyl-CoA synthetase (AMP-forming)/AMP-acid ligase II